MITRFHLPSQIEVPEAVASEDRDRLQRMVLTTIRAAIERTAADSAQMVVDAPGSAEQPRERFSPTRLTKDRSTYAIPSYDDGGAPSDVPIKQTGEATEAPPLKVRWR